MTSAKSCRYGGAIVCAILLAGHVLPAAAATLEVGPGKAFAQPSKAIAAAHDGDTVLIAPGTYFDCAIVHRSDLTIAGSDPAATVLTDKPCAGKALLVIDGRNVTVKDLTLTRVRVPDGNGAGIRAEGHTLIVDGVQFINDQVGILAAAVPDSTLTVRNSLFQRNGDCSVRCGHDITAGGLQRLRVENSVFEASGGSNVYSLNQPTELVGNRFDARTGPRSGPLVFIGGGALTLLNNTITLGPGDRPGAVLVTGDPAAITVQGNTLQEPQGGTVPLLRNWTGTAAVSADNTVPAGSVAVSDAGATYHRFRSWLAGVRDSLHAAAHEAKHGVGVVLHKLHLR